MVESSRLFLLYSSKCGYDDESLLWMTVLLIYNCTFASHFTREEQARFYETISVRETQSVRQIACALLWIFEMFVQLHVCGRSYVMTDTVHTYTKTGYFTTMKHSVTPKRNINPEGTRPTARRQAFSTLINIHKRHKHTPLCTHVNSKCM